MILIAIKRLRKYLSARVLTEVCAEIFVNNKAWNVDGSPMGKNVSRLKLGDLGKWVQGKRYCLLCDQECNDILFHMFVECPEEKSSDGAIRSSRGKKLQSKEDIKYWLGGINRETQAGVSEKVKKWRKCQQRTSYC